MKKTHFEHLNIAQNIIVLMHRISGVGILLFLPFVLYCFSLSLNPNELVNQAVFLAHPCVKLIWLVLTWLYTVHTLIEIRQLFLDIRIGLEFQTIKISTFCVIIVSFLIMIMTGIFLMGTSL